MSQGQSADGNGLAFVMVDDKGRRQDSAYACLVPVIQGAPLKQSLGCAIW